MKTTASFSNKISTTKRPKKCHAWVVQIRIQQIQDGRGRHFENRLNSDVSAAVSSNLMIFGMVTQIDRAIPKEIIENVYLSTV